ncbi:MAG TPA: energy transducer TonB [Candidatus Acidoferrum sp.]|nr:energy transducer TonB [Candidatus Acidoferrum sp.]
MAPSAIAEVLINKETRPQIVSPTPRPSPPSRPSVERGPARGRGFFKEALLENHRFKSSSKTLDLLVALSLHVVVVAGPILAGLYYTDTLNLKEFTRTLLVAPPPPPPPPPAPAAGIIKAQAPKRVFMTGGKLVAPTVIPRQIAEIKEAPLEPDSLGGVAGGVPGGVPGGQMGGVLGGVIGGVLNTAAKPIAPPTGKPSAPVRVGGRVRPPKVIVQTHPNYPPLARQARVQGQVLVDAILDEQGNVVDMKVVSGPPLLYQAALDALKTWKYEPTYLNDQPIAVEMIVTITFQLGQ